MNIYQSLKDYFYISEVIKTPFNNSLYILREDLIPYSFGGNKVRKALNFFDEIIKQGNDIVITYGSHSSNHARIIANMAFQHNIKCIVISPISDADSMNKLIIEHLNVEIIKTDLNKVSQTIDETIFKYKSLGHNPYFIEGGGHGNPGTKAYVDVFEQILLYETKNNLKFDYIFFATGTGTTQAGLIAGNIINKSNKQIVGISISRTTERAVEIISHSVIEYLNTIKFDNYIFRSEMCNVKDDYIVSGYGTFNEEIEDTILQQFRTNGIPLDPTYTGKAFWGMTKYINETNIKNKNILFIHTGGTPIFFDYIDRRSSNK